MNKFKYLTVVVLTTLLAVVVSCKDKDDAEKEGREAGTLMCECVTAYTAPDPADFGGDMEAFQLAFMAYAQQLYECLGVISQYEKYVEVDIEAYDDEAADPLYTVFIFKDPNFEKGFKEATAGCKNAFDALLALLQ